MAMEVRRLHLVQNENTIPLNDLEMVDSDGVLEQYRFWWVHQSMTSRIHEVYDRVDRLRADMRVGASGRAASLFDVTTGLLLAQETLRDGREETLGLAQALLVASDALFDYWLAYPEDRVAARILAMYVPDRFTQRFLALLPSDYVPHLRAYLAKVSS